MNNLKRVKIIIFLFFVSLTANAGDQKYEYVSYDFESDVSHAPSSFSISTKDRVLYVGHAGRGVKFCAPQDEHYCFTSPGLSFSVPKSSLFIGKKWKRANQTYSVVGNESLELLGLKLAVYRITSPISANRTDHFYYSEQYGLVAISTKYTDKSDSKFYFSRYLYGFPKEEK